MAVSRNRTTGILLACAIAAALALTIRPHAARAEPQGVLNQHIVLLDREAAAFRAKDAGAIASGLTDDYVRVGALGERTSRAQELEALERLFRAATRLRETSQPVRLTVQGGDAQNPTVATTLVQTSRTAEIAGPDGVLHTTTWDTVTKEERIDTAGGWRCRKREELKRTETRDGARVPPNGSAVSRAAAAAIQREYDSLADALDTGDEAAVRNLASSSEIRGVDGKTMSGAEWLAAIETLRKASWHSDVRYVVTGIALRSGGATVTCERTLVRQAPDKDGVYRTSRVTTTLRDTWRRSGVSWSLRRSEALLAEHATLQPLEAGGWE